MPVAQPAYLSAMAESGKMTGRKQDVSWRQACGGMGPDVLSQMINGLTPTCRARPAMLWKIVWKAEAKSLQLQELSPLGLAIHIITRKWAAITLNERAHLALSSRGELLHW